MATNWELQLIAKVLETGDFKSAVKEKISLDILQNEEARAIWQTLVELYESKGHIPSRSLIEERHPSLHLPTEVEDELSILCDHVRRGYISSELANVALEIGDLAPSNPDQALVTLNSANARLSKNVLVGEDYILSASTKKAKLDYLLRKKLRLENKILGIRYPWEVLTKESGGMLPGDYVLLYGRPKSMKTFITCHIAADAYFRQHRRVLFFTREMSPDQIISRVLCSVAEVDYGEFRKGEVPEDKEPEMFRVIEGLRVHEKDMVEEHSLTKEPIFIIASDTRADGGGVTALRALIEQYSPDIVFVDGLYLMRDDREGKKSRDWHNIANISTDLKQTAVKHRIPIVANNQANRLSGDKRKDSGIKDMGFSDAPAQDADLILRVDRGFDELGNPRINLIVSGAREFALDGIVIGAQPCTNFDFIKLYVAHKNPKQEQDAAEKKTEGFATSHRAKLERGTMNTTLNSRPLLAENRTKRADKRRTYAADFREDQGIIKTEVKPFREEEFSERTRSS